MTDLSALCIFSGDLPRTSPDAAAKALEDAGYRVLRLPPDLQAKLDESVNEGWSVEGDDFIEIRCESDDESVMWVDAQLIVARFGGCVDCVGAASETTFEELRMSSAFRVEEQP